MMGRFGDVNAVGNIRMASPDQNLELKMADLSKRMNLNIKIRGLKKWRYRFWIAMKLFKLAAWIFPTEVNIEYQEEDDERTGYSE